MEIEIFKPHNRPRLTTPELTETIELTCRETGIEPKSINIVFLNDAELCMIHDDFLGDVSPTDVITFDLGDEAIEAEIYISIDMAGKNADFFLVPFDDEIHRLIIHGLLHLAGYDDRSPADKKRMEKEENRLVVKRCGY